jgi:hypothetical protein
MVTEKSKKFAVQPYSNSANILFRTAPPAFRAWSWVSDPGFPDPPRHKEPASTVERFRPTGRPSVAAGQHARLAAHPVVRPALAAEFNPPEALMSSVMSFMPVVWIVWAAVITFLLVLLVYRSNLTRYEEDQIFLDEAANHQKQEQEELLAKVNKIQPLIRIVTGATCALTVGILGVYVWDALQHLM